MSLTGLFTRGSASAGHLCRNLPHSSLPGYGLSLTGLVLDALVQNLAKILYTLLADLPLCCLSLPRPIAQVDTALSHSSTRLVLALVLALLMQHLATILYILLAALPPYYPFPCEIPGSSIPQILD